MCLINERSDFYFGVFFVVVLNRKWKDEKNMNSLLEKENVKGLKLVKRNGRVKKSKNFTELLLLMV